jgi:phosphate transport system ATP-binding protein
MSAYPPPIRRIVVDAPPTVAAPAAPPQQGRANGVATAEEHVAAAAAARSAAGPERMTLEDLSVFYADKPAVKSVSLPIHQGQVLALIGPSGCGKTTLLRTLNRLTELTPSARTEGRILIDGEDIDLLEATALRRRVSMVFQQPNPFPMSVFDNVAYALREQSRRRPGRSALMPKVEEALHRA